MIQPIKGVESLQMGGLVPLTSIDFPGCLSAVLFFQGCPWRCGYCHNPHLLSRHGENKLRWSDVTSFLRRRQGLLDAVVFSGGEPTLQDSIQIAASEVHDLGFKVGLHTGGMYPSRFKKLLPLLSWVGMDIKTTFLNYDRVTGGGSKSGERALESAQQLLESGVPYEFRTTVHPLYHTRDSLLRLADELQKLGVKHYRLQEFRSQGCANGVIKGHSSREILDDATGRQIEDRFESFSILRA